MDKQELNRRKLLSGILATGGAGALVGRGTTALFTDEETFTNNNIQASNSVAGVVDLTIGIEEMDEMGVVYEISLPTTDADSKEDINNNPSHVWFRSVECPDRTANPEVTLQLSCDGGSSPVKIATGKLRDVLTREKIRKGHLLSCPGGTEDCLRPGETRKLQFRLEEDPDSSVSFKLKFYGQQCRYNTAPDIDNPFTETGPESCCVPCTSGEDQIVKFDDFDEMDGQLDFNVEPEGGDENFELTDYKLDGNGELTEACFETDYCGDVYAVVKAGKECMGGGSITKELADDENGDFCVTGFDSNGDGNVQAISNIQFYCEEPTGGSDDPSCTNSGGGPP